MDLKIPRISKSFTDIFSKKRRNGKRMEDEYDTLKDIEYTLNFMSMAELGALEEVERILKENRFLGDSENLYELKRIDYEKLREMNVDYEDISSALETFLNNVVSAYKKTSESTFFVDKNYAVMGIEEQKGFGEKLLDKIIKPISDFFKKETEEEGMQSVEDFVEPEYKVNILSDSEERSVDCPWSYLTGDFTELNCNHTNKRNLEILITNIGTGESIHIYEIHAHLISKHRFFEGNYRFIRLKNQYRIDPEKLIKVLNIKRKQKKQHKE